MSTTQRDARWDLPELRTAYLAALERLLEASQELRDALTDGASALMVVRERAENEERVSDLFSLIDPRPLRTSLTGALTELERSRHASQKLLFLMNESRRLKLSGVRLKEAVPDAKLIGER